jgi:hypothetical protein
MWLRVSTLTLFSLFEIATESVPEGPVGVGLYYGDTAAAVEFPGR